MSTVHDEGYEAPGEVEDHQRRPDRAATVLQSQPGTSNIGDPEQARLPEEDEGSDKTSVGSLGYEFTIDGQVDTSDLPQAAISRWTFTKKPSSADGSLLIPDDSPSPRSLASPSKRRDRAYAHGQGLSSSLQPFERRLTSRLSSTSSQPAKNGTLALRGIHSRNSSIPYSIKSGKDVETEVPWEVVRWNKLKNLSGQAFSEVGKRKFGQPTCIAISAFIVLGTSRGMLLVFDYNQNMKAIIGTGTQAVEAGSVTSVGFSADHSTIAAGHTSGQIFTWELANPAKPFLHIHTVDKTRTPDTDGHVVDAAVLHIGFLGIRHTALASADDKGMAFSHLASRGMGMVARSVRTTRILGRYSDASVDTMVSRKPSSVLSFSPMPLGNVAHMADTMGLIAMLTPYLLVIVSTAPIAQTQFKIPRSKHIASHSAMSGALAWFPAVKVRSASDDLLGSATKAKLAYSWSNVLMVLDITEVESNDPDNKTDLHNMIFEPRSHWTAEESIVSIQWLNRSVLAALTVSQQLILIEDMSMQVINSSDLIQKHIYHIDLFSPQLYRLVDQLEDEEISTMHGVIADAFYMSFRAYKGRLFLLGFNEISFGTLSNWADRLTALVEHGSAVEAIRLATGYYTGEADTVTVGLPENSEARHNVVSEKLSGLILATLEYTFARPERNIAEGDTSLLSDLASASIEACIYMDDMDFLFDDVYAWFHENGYMRQFLQSLTPRIYEGDIQVLPPEVLKILVTFYIDLGLDARLEEILVKIDPRTMDIDQITIMCRKYCLYDALLYVWNKALEDYTTILAEMIDLAVVDDLTLRHSTVNADRRAGLITNIFTYLSYILTGRIYPTGEAMQPDEAELAKADLYAFLFSGRASASQQSVLDARSSSRHSTDSSFQNLRKLLDLDTASFFAMLNEAFEDHFLNGPEERAERELLARATEAQAFGFSLNRQLIISVLLETLVSSSYDLHDTIYLDMFIARSMPKFPQFLMLPGHILQNTLLDLCRYPDSELLDDCQLSTEYLLSIYQPPDLAALIPMFHQAKFYRILKQVYNSEKQYPQLLMVCFEDQDHFEDIFVYIREALKHNTEMHEQDAAQVRNVLIQHAQMLLTLDTKSTAQIIDRYACDLHKTMLRTLKSDEAAQFEYLRAIMDRSAAEELTETKAAHDRQLIEQYVRLLCRFDTPRLGSYIDQISIGDLRLEEILPTLEQNGAMDTALVLLARDGQVQEGMSRLVKHLDSLEAAFLGVLDGEATNDQPVTFADVGFGLIESMRVYARIGLWICQQQSKTTTEDIPAKELSKTVRSVDRALSETENLWLDLIETVVNMVRKSTEAFEDIEELPVRFNRDSLRPQTLIALRAIVQEVFTALLASTTVQRAVGDGRTNLSFLHVLRAILSRIAQSSPSLTNLRNVLGAIFAAYSYEEEVLSLANRLLDQDLFIHVTEVNDIRKRGWRPLGQVCEACGKRLWGPGSGSQTWEAWDCERRHRDARRMTANDGQQSSTGRGALEQNQGRHEKGKSIAEISVNVDGREVRDLVADPKRTPKDTADRQTGGLVIFACRHIYHRSCLEEVLQSSRAETVTDPSLAPKMTLHCLLCD